MMKRPAEILIIDDDVNLQRCLSAALSPVFTVHVACNGEDGLSQYERHLPDAVLLDVMLPQMTGLAVLRALRRMSADLPVIMMTAYAEIQTAVQAIKLGALDYVQKPLDAEAVSRQIAQLLDRGEKQQAPVHAGLIGESPAMRRVRQLIESFAPTDIPILLQGETGTGKGLVAGAIHKSSKRARESFIAIDCGTLPEQLAESELFGYEDGAVT